MRNVQTILVEKPERERALGKPRHRLEDNIKKNLKKEGMDWIQLAQDQVQWLLQTC
jgi:hypothetical protein